MPTSTGSIQPEQKLNLAFKTISDKPPKDKNSKRLRKSEQQKLKKEAEELKFSSVGLKENKCHSIHSPPFLDFLKPCFDFGQAKKAPSLKGT